MAVNKQRQRLEAILERLESGEDVSLRDFKNAIPTDEYGNYEQAVEFRKMELTGAFGYCADYEKWLKKGIFEYNRAEGFYGKNNKNYQKFHHQAQVYFENAIEALREEFGQNPNIALAYDRGIELDAGVDEGGGLDPSSMPRLKSSKSHMMFDRDSRKIDKRKLKIEAAKRAIAELITEERSESRSTKKSGQLENKKEVKRKEGKEGTEGIKREEGKEDNARKRAVSDAQGDKLRAMLKKLHETERTSSK
jgi:hypothetical protein